MDEGGGKCLHKSPLSPTYVQSITGRDRDPARHSGQTQAACPFKRDRRGLGVGWEGSVGATEARYLLKGDVNRH